MNILFVCTGNTCRSPMAEAVLQHKAPNMNVKSAGIFAHENDSANDYTIEALRARGISFTHFAKRTTKGILDWADLILTMTDAHRQLLVESYPQSAEKTFTFIDYVTKNDSEKEASSMNQDIADPFGGELHVYKKTLSEIEDYVDQLIKKV